MADTHIKRFVKQFSVKTQQYLADIPVDVLVLGPSISSKVLVPAARLRKELLHRCRKYGAGVKGEHSQLMKEAAKRLGAGNNLCTYERMLAKEVDLIVIVPDSPGSFAELGLLALEDRAGPKTVVLFSREFRNRRSYIMQGPKKAFQMRSARIKYVDYASVEQSWGVVEKAIEEKKAMKVDTKLSLHTK